MISVGVGQQTAQFSLDLSSIFMLPHVAVELRELSLDSHPQCSSQR